MSLVQQIVQLLGQDNQLQGGNPAQYQQIYNSYNIEQQDMQAVQNYISLFYAKQLLSYIW